MNKAVNGCMNVNEARSYNHCCRGKTVSIKYCVSSFCYPTCNAHAPHCHLWPARLYNIFSTLSHKRQILLNNLLKVKCCFDFLCNICLKLISGFHRALLQSIAFISRLNALDYTKLRG